jgi:hypothetical protein
VSDSQNSDDADDVTDEIERLLDARLYAEVEDFCTRLMSNHATEFRLFYHRAQAKNLRGDTRGAIDDLTSAITHNGSEPALFYFRGLWSLEGGDYQFAEKDLAAALEKEASLGSSFYSESARLARAVALLKLGDFTGADAECLMISTDQRTFLLGRQWTVSEVRDLAGKRKRP